MNETGVTPEAKGARARIERSALSLFCIRGVDAVTTREIASASGVSEGALYRHYSSKESLAETMFFAIHTRLAGEVTAAADSASGIEDKARAVVAAYTQIADEDWTLFSYHLLTTHRFLPFVEKTARDGDANPVAIIEDIVRRAAASGEIHSADPALKAAAALGVVLQSALHKIYGRIQGDLSAHQESLSRAVIAVLKS